MTYEKVISGILSNKPDYSRSDASKFLWRFLLCSVSIFAFLVWIFYILYERELVFTVGLASFMIYLAINLRELVDDTEYLDLWTKLSKFWYIFILVAVTGGVAFWYFL